MLLELKKPEHFLLSVPSGSLSLSFSLSLRLFLRGVLRHTLLLVCGSKMPSSHCQGRVCFHSEGGSGMCSTLQGCGHVGHQGCPLKEWWPLSGIAPEASTTGLHTDVLFHLPLSPSLSVFITLFPFICFVPSSFPHFHCFTIISRILS